MRVESPKVKVPKLIKDNRRKPNFEYDCFTKIPHVVPGVQTYAEFDWEGLFAACDGPSPGTERDQQIKRLATALNVFLRWLVTETRDLTVIGERAVVAQTFIEPDAVPRHLSATLNRSRAARNRVRRPMPKAA